MKTEQTKTCTICGETFVTTTPSKICCGEACYRVRKRQKDRENQRRRAARERQTRQAERAKEKAQEEKRVMEQVKKPVDMASRLYPDAVEVNTKTEGWESGWIPVGDRKLPPELLAQ